MRVNITFVFLKQRKEHISKENKRKEEHVHMFCEKIIIKYVNAAMIHQLFVHVLLLSEG